MAFEISKHIITKKTTPTSAVEPRKEQERRMPQPAPQQAPPPPPRDPNQKLKLNNILDELSETDMELIGGDETDNKTIDVEKSLSIESPIIIKGLSAIMVNAIEVGATDIHIEAYERVVRVRYRIDGELKEMQRMSPSILNALVSRVKILSNLDIAERRLPQDGRMKMRMAGRDIDFRIAIMPTIYGEKVAIRILDQGAVDMKLEKLGFTEDEYSKILKSILSPHGIILVTGPTGSGKSTTLYSILNHLNTEEVNISTVEDPVEYNIEGINQVQAKAEIGLTFAAALRQFLRQDPDIVMLGEIRDGETAEIAIKAALTGHLVLSTLHTNDAVGTVMRLINMGVDAFLISAALEMVISQRLLRRVCSECKKVDENYERKLKVLGFNPEEYRDKVFYTGNNDTSCPKCKGSGYKGRLAVHEILTMTEDLRVAIDNNESSLVMTDIAKKDGMLTLKEDGIKKCLEGITTLDEVIKSCQ